MFETGGMPSSHSALITGAASGIGCELGFDSPVFALSVAIAFIVMYDASGVRKSAGIQAAEINKISRNEKDNLIEVRGPSTEANNKALMGFLKSNGINDVKKLIKSATPMKKFGTADDIAWAAVYLASDESKFVTGQTISPNGGFVMSQ